ncbi:hypothetical protein LB542_19895 [Mesorhizobium sp. BR1-1-9]|uniref:hypothetical protein n=1 Tax=Mesorhizobium sp. BR1-1-9 TaxID=2876646 RepID=UPI001CD0A4F7|nr:hypothetical protein [Mesorhizobium sp. BR1-1-9]MBZ9873114.1 hypothetical protein [Mesorhizobium sp. BR1-1-9]
MTKYLITWNAGYGESAVAEDYETEAEANEAAYERWREEAETNADYSARPLTRKLAEDYDLEDELEDDDDEVQS